MAVLLPDGLGDRLPSELRRLRAVFSDRAYCALTRLFLPDEAARLRDHANAAAQAGVATVVTNDVLYHCPSRRLLQDVVTCIRLHTHDRSCGVSEGAARRPLSEDRRKRCCVFSKLRSGRATELGDSRAVARFPSTN